MSHLIAALKHEIICLARKEIRVCTGHVKQAATQHRREIAKLKRDLKAHEKKIEFLEGREKERIDQPAVAQDALSGARFSANSVRAQRKRLKLSAEDFAKLLGVSGQTVHMWEQGKSWPRRAQFAALVAVRELGKREVVARLAALNSSRDRAKHASRKKLSTVKH